MIKFLFCITPFLLFGFSSKEVFEKFPNTYFVETGSYLGEGIQLALDTGSYDQIISIELSPHYASFCKSKFASNKNVKILLGDSGQILFRIMKSIDKTATFWLDGHWSGGNTARGSKISPIMEELEAIKSSKIKNHVILIDDVRGFGGDQFDYHTLDEVVDKIKEINPNYKIAFYDCAAAKGDILAAFIEEDLLNQTP